MLMLIFHSLFMICPSGARPPSRFDASRRLPCGFSWCIFPVIPLPLLSLSASTNASDDPPLSWYLRATKINLWELMALAHHIPSAPCSHRNPLTPPPPPFCSRHRLILASKSCKLIWRPGLPTGQAVDCLSIQWHRLSQEWSHHQPWWSCVELEALINCTWQYSAMWNTGSDRLQSQLVNYIDWKCCTKRKG